MRYSLRAGLAGLLLLLAAVLGMLFGGGASSRRAAAGTDPGAGEGEGPAAKPNVVKIGGVTWHRKERRLEVDGRVCLEEGPLEYFAVIKGGKEYESVLAFDCRAIDLNLALIGAGYKASGGVRRIGDPNVPKGDPVFLHVEWKDDDGKVKRVRAEGLLWNQVTKKPMRQTAWVFSGSSFRRDPDTGKLYFMAEEERKLVAVYRDPAAMFNSPLDTGQDDVFYVVNKNAMPKPAKYVCARHEEVTSAKPGKCPKCESPLMAVGRSVKLIMEPAPAEALAPENLKDGADLVEPSDEENPPNFKGPDGKPPAGEKAPG
jgi:hypothetical protein